MTNGTHNAADADADASNVEAMTVLLTQGHLHAILGALTTMARYAKLSRDTQTAAGALDKARQDQAVINLTFLVGIDLIKQIESRPDWHRDSSHAFVEGWGKLVTEFPTRRNDDGSVKLPTEEGAYVGTPHEKFQRALERLRAAYAAVTAGKGDSSVH